MDDLSWLGMFDRDGSWQVWLSMCCKVTILHWGYFFRNCCPPSFSFAIAFAVATGWPRKHVFNRSVSSSAKPVMTRPTKQNDGWYVTPRYTLKKISRGKPRQRWGNTSHSFGTMERASRVEDKWAARPEDEYALIRDTLSHGIYFPRVVIWLRRYGSLCVTI